MAAEHRPLRVLVVIDSLGQGGAEASLAAVLPLLRAKGDEVTLLLLRSVAPAKEAALRAAGVQVAALGGDGGYLAVARELRREFRQRRPDLIHATLFTPIVCGALGRIGLGIPFLASLVNTPVKHGEPTSASGRPWKLRLAGAVEGFVLRHAVDHLHAVTDGVRRDVAATYGVPLSRITVAERGRDCVRFAPPSASSRAQARRELVGEAPAEIVVALGRHEPAKGFSDLLAATDLLREERPWLRVFLAGRKGLETAGLERDLRERKLDDRLVLLPERDDPEVLLAAADLFVLSSRREGTSGATLEAMAMGIPVVATSLLGLEGIVIDGITARTVPPGDPKSISMAMAELLDDRELAADLARNARAMFLERFTVERSAASLDQLYRKVAER